ncbi:RluA family pseudouridine synthase [Beggiatoa alba]|nr:RluA family pseudouridine synthase [Beggiatoa alba]
MPISLSYSPPPDDPEILYLDNDLLIVNKPAGLLTVPGRGEEKQDCLISRIQAHSPEALIVHRLDLATSGLLVLARNPHTHRQLSKQFQNRKISKEYIAIVDGLVIKQTGEIDLPLITDWPNRPKQKIDLDNGKPSQTHYEIISSNREQNTTRLKLIPITGRSHQLRVHLLKIGHVIIGDGLYSESQAKKNQRLHLHATKMEFTHPSKQQTVCFASPCPF